MREINITDKEAGQRLDKYLMKYLPLAPMSFFYKMLRKKNIVLNRKKAEGKEILKSGDLLQLYFAEDTIAGFQKKDDERCKMVNEYIEAYQKIKGITVVYEDCNVLALYKPANVLSQKAGPKDRSINEWAIGYLLKNGGISEEELTTFKPSVVNRLDRNTSGLILVGKSLKGSQTLSEAIKSHHMRKFYRTICFGKPQKDQLSLKGYLVKNEKTNKVTIQEKGKGDYIETGMKKIFDFSVDGQVFTYLEIQLITGKSHQIRAHLASIGLPIVGDDKYGNANKNEHLKKELHLQGQMLHAYRLEFPEELKKLLALSQDTLIAPLPDYFEKMLKER